MRLSHSFSNEERAGGNKIPLLFVPLRCILAFLLLLAIALVPLC